MEAAAIAQVCGRHGVPFMTVKDISNNEFHALTDLGGNISVLHQCPTGRRDRPPRGSVVTAYSRADRNALIGAL
jgi:hypothetical protein